MPREEVMPVIEHFSLCENEVYKVPWKLDPRKATGPDSFPTIVKVVLLQGISPSLCALFNLSLAEGKLPMKWKDSLVVPVFEKGKKKDVALTTDPSLYCVLHPKCLNGE